MKVLVLGSGFIADHLPYDRISEHVEVDWQKTRALMSHYRPQVLINCMGKTGRPNVDWCEKHKTSTAEGNVTIPLILADLCEKFDTHLIQLGSGCIYFGDSPHARKFHTPEKMKLCPPDISHDEWLKIYDYKSDEWTWKDPGWKEEDFANPESFYSKSKYACDLMLGSMPHVTTLRIRMPVSDKDTPRNLINKLRGYKQVIDIPNSMTIMSDLTRCVDWVIKNGIKGTYHVANPQPITAAQIMTEFQKYVPEHQFEIINEQQLDDMTLAKRSNCILNTDKLTNAGFKMTNSEEAITECMANYVKNMRRT